jgi:hypothetical protein
MSLIQKNLVLKSLLEVEKLVEKSWMKRSQVEKSWMKRSQVEVRNLEEKSWMKRNWRKKSLMKERNPFLALMNQ